MRNQAVNVGHQTVREKMFPVGRLSPNKLLRPAGSGRATKIVMLGKHLPQECVQPLADSKGEPIDLKMLERLILITVASATRVCKERKRNL